MTTWTESELMQAKEFLESGKTYEEIGERLNRSWGSIRNKLYRTYGIKRTDFYNSYVIKTCKQCGTEFTVSKGSDRKHNHRFCSQSCSATYNNNRRIHTDKTKIKISKSLGGSGKLTTYCLNCNTLLSRKNSKYCNHKCQTEHKRKEIINKWLAGELTGMVDGGSLQLLKAVRDWVFERAKHKCEECGNQDINPYTGNSILQIDHIDGDASNTIPPNLKVLCPNCHAKTPTYKAHNRKSARNQYRKITRPF